MTRARDVADTQDNVGGAVAPFVAGKNKIINGDFGIWQRGTSFSTPTTITYTADRFAIERFSGACTVSRQSFTPGTAPVAGYESTFFHRISISSAGDIGLRQAIEDVRTFAGQTITASFWAKASTATTLDGVLLLQRYGSGGSGETGVTVGTGQVIGTTWQRYSFTTTMPSISGKTIGTNSNFAIRIDPVETFVGDFDTWGIMIENGSQATPFTPAGGGFPGAELALCQRYYQRFNTTTTFGRLGMGMATGTTNVQCVFPLKTTMRTVASSLDFSGASNFVMNDGVNNYPTTGLTLDVMGTTDNGFVIFTVSSGLTQYRPYTIAGNNNGAAYIGFSAEL